jgi:hypothetical protein
MLHVMKSSAESSVIGGIEIPADRRYCIATIYDSFKNNFAFVCIATQNQARLTLFFVISWKINYLLRTIARC